MKTNHQLLLVAAVSGLVSTAVVHAASTIEFSASSHTVAENAGPVTLSVQRADDVETLVTVDYATVDGTATNGVKYTAVSGTLTFTAGVTNQAIAIPILNEGAIEGTKNFTVVLSNPTGGAVLGSRATASVRITDNDYGLQFEFATYFIAENAGAVPIVIVRGDDGLFPITVEYATSDGTAKAGQHYEAISGTVTFAEEEKLYVIRVPILNHVAKEAGRSFRMTLSNPTGGGVLGSTRSATVTITDIDPGVQLEHNGYWITDFEPAVAVKILRGNNQASEAFTVDYATSDLTAKAGEQYVDTHGTLRFESGETAKNLSIPILYRDGTASEMAFKLSLTSPSGGVPLGTSHSATIRILASTGTVPHHFAEIAVQADRSVQLTLTGGLHQRFQQYFDLYPIEVSTDLVKWTPLVTLQRKNNATNALTYADGEAPAFPARFYRTAATNFVTPLLRPTGPYAVGVASRFVVDPSRTNRYGVATNSAILVNVWYPANSQAAGFPSSWSDAAYRWDADLLQWLGQVPYFHSYAIPGAAPERGELPWPVLLYSHGGRGDRNQHVDLAEELASHGYIVVFPDHMHAWVSLLPDGRVVDTKAMPQQTWQSITTLNDSMTDMSVLLDELARWNAESGWLAGMVDVDNVALAGASMGAWVPMEICRQDPRCRAAVLVELGTGMGEVVQRLAQQNVPAPLLMLNASGNSTTLFFDRASKDAAWVQISDTTHEMFSSSYWYERPSDVAGGMEVSRTIRGYTLWFLNKYLKKVDQPIPTRSEFPRVMGIRQK